MNNKLFSQPKSHQTLKIKIGPTEIFLHPDIALLCFLHYEDSLVSSNLNSKLLWFHCAHPKFMLVLSNFLSKR